MVIIAFDQPNGDCPASDYIDTLMDKEQIPVLTLLQRLGHVGPLANPQKFKKLHGVDLYEIKSDQHRIFSFYGRLQEDGRPTLVLGHTYRKKTDRTRRQELDKALHLKDVYFRGGEI